MAKKVAIVITDLFEDVEYFSPKAALEAAGHETVAISPKGGATIEGKKGKTTTSDKGIDEVKAEDYDALFIPGGYSPDKLRADERFLAFTQKFDQANKPIFSICHGPQLLINAEVIKGKTVTSAPQVGIDLTNAGANFVDKEVAVDDSGLISSRSPDDLPAFNKAIVDSLNQL